MNNLLEICRRFVLPSRVSGDTLDFNEANERLKAEDEALSDFFFEGKKELADRVWVKLPDSQLGSSEKNIISV